MTLSPYSTLQSTSDSYSKREMFHFTALTYSLLEREISALQLGPISGTGR